MDYVQHYAAITATYLSLEGKYHDNVHYILPSQAQCLLPLLRSNLLDMGPMDIVIVGYVHGLLRWTDGPWGGDKNHELFAWKTLLTRQGYRVAFLGCRVSFWGDIARNMVRALTVMNNAKCVLYVGKLGSLHAEHVPNHWLATGCQSMVHGEMFTWDNPLKELLQYAPNAAHGIHYTLGSVLDETKEWLTSAREQYDFVDPEIGHMAKTAMEEGMEFGYLHIIFDNLAKKYIHDLSNERLKDVLRERRKLVKEIEDVLGHFFDQWVPG